MNVSEATTHRKGAVTHKDQFPVSCAQREKCREDLGHVCLGDTWLDLRLHHGTGAHVSADPEPSTVLSVAKGSELAVEMQT